jgi:dienelactone hydrolase
MKWEDATAASLLADGAVARAVQTFVLDRLPVFDPPTGPDWPTEAVALRARAREALVERGTELFGTTRPRVQWCDELSPRGAYRIRKLRYEVLPDYWIPALLYQPSELLPDQRVPVVLNPNGHWEAGKASTTKQARCANLALRGMLALSFEFVGMGELGGDRDHNRLCYLELAGVAAPSVMFRALERGLDVLLEQPNADPTRVAVTGVSGGGWQSLLLAALDERVTVSVPVAGYTSNARRAEYLDDIGDLEQVPADMSSTIDYQQLTALLAPRPTLLILNHDDDCCFPTGRTKPVIYDAVRPVFEALGAAEQFTFYDNLDPGTHNYDADNRAALYRFLNRHFGLSHPEHDLHDDAELLVEHDLNVGLPDDQLTLQALAVRCIRKLRVNRRTPQTDQEKHALRAQVAAVLRLPEYEPVQSWPATRGAADSVVVDVGGWQVPATVLLRGSELELHVVDGGRHEVGQEKVEASDNSFVALDLLGLGENRCDPRIQMMIGCVGERLLGIQVAQLTSVARGLASSIAPSRVHLVGRGYMSQLVVLLAAALAPGLFDTVTTDGGGLATLEHLVERGVSYEEAQSTYCFGLLDVADVPELIALLDGVTFTPFDRTSPCVHSTVSAMEALR